MPASLATKAYINCVATQVTSLYCDMLTAARVAATRLHVPVTDVHVPVTDVHVPVTDVHVPVTDVHISSAPRWLTCSMLAKAVMTNVMVRGQID